MSGRVTQTMLNSQLLRNLNNNLGRLENLQNQMSTGRKINKPSDDPVGISFSLRYRSEIAENDQYERNVNSAMSWLEYSDKMLGQVNDVMQRARELAVQGSNETNPQTALDNIASEISQLYEQLVEIGNSKFNGKYVFNGELTDIKPYTVADADTETTDSGKIQFAIGVGVKLPINVTGEEVFGAPGEESNTFALLKEMESLLKQGDTAGVSNLLGNLDKRMDRFLGLRAEVGAKTNRVELAENRIADININLTSMQAKTEDADMAELIMQIKMDENVYQASLSAGAQLIKPSLLDFLR